MFWTSVRAGVVVWMFATLLCLFDVALTDSEYNKLIWQDNFDLPYLDRNSWDVEVNCWGGGNLEKQCYTDRQDNIAIEDGKLKLKAVSDEYMGKVEYCTLNNENSCTWTQPTTSGRIRTKRSFYGSWMYGRFEAKARLPKGEFLWPAFWMLPTEDVYGSWPLSGEIDIMEFRGQSPTKVSSTVHFGPEWPNNLYNSSGEIDIGVDLTEDFHIYACEWSKDKIEFYVDDRKIFEYNLDQKVADVYKKNGSPFDQKFHIILNLAVGGNFFDSKEYGKFNESSVETWKNAVFEVDYVKVYGKSESESHSNNIEDVKRMAMGDISAEFLLPVHPETDTFVDGLFSKLSFNHESVLCVRSSNNGHDRVSYLKFYIPYSEKPVAAASLLLYGALDDDSVQNAVVNVHPVLNNNWNGAFIYYENKLAWESCAATTTVNNEPGWFAWDVKHYVEAIVKHNRNVITFAVRIDNPVNIRALFGSSESDSVNKPMLVLAY